MSWNITGRVLVAAGALALAVPIFAAPAAAQAYGEVATPTLSLNLHAGPSVDAPVIGVLEPGMPVTEGITTFGGWTNVNSPAGEGWADNRFLAPR